LGAVTIRRLDETTWTCEPAWPLNETHAPRTTDDSMVSGLARRTHGAEPYG
jgi:hypothetical protein